MRGLLDFSLPEEQDEFELASNAGSYKACLYDLHQKLIRPYRKHGYGGKLGSIAQKNPELIEEFMSVFEDDFWEIVKEYKVTIE